MIKHRSLAVYGVFLAGLLVLILLGAIILTSFDDKSNVAPGALCVELHYVYGSEHIHAGTMCSYTENQGRGSGLPSGAPGWSVRIDEETNNVEVVVDFSNMASPPPALRT
jgi:hypothetical protein